MVNNIKVTPPLRAERERQNLSQQMLADFTALSLSTIKRAEQGKPIRPDARDKICKHFNRSSTELGLLSEEFPVELESSSRRDTHEQDQEGKDVKRRDMLKLAGLTSLTLISGTSQIFNGDILQQFSKALSRPSYLDDMA